MGLKSVVESLDSIDENLRGFYKPIDGGKFVLDVEDIRAHPATLALQNAFETTKNERNDFRTKLTAAEEKLRELPEDFDAAKWHEYKADAEKTKDGQNKQVENLTRLHESRIQNIEQKHAGEIRERDELIESLETRLDRTSLDNELKGLLVSNRVDGDFLDAATLMIGRKVKTVRADNGDRVNVVETDLGEQPLSGYVKAWAESDGKKFLAKPTGLDAAGGDNRRQQEPNPWAKDTANLTQQGHILRVDRDRARRLMQAAGIPDATISSRLGA